MQLQVSRGSRQGRGRSPLVPAVPVRYWHTTLTLHPSHLTHSLSHLTPHTHPSLTAIGHQADWSCVCSGCGATSVLPAGQGRVLCHQHGHAHSRAPEHIPCSGTDDRASSPPCRGLPSASLSSCLQVHHVERGEGERQRGGPLFHSTIMSCIVCSYSLSCVLVSIPFQSVLLSFILKCLVIFHSNVF